MHIYELMTLFGVSMIVGAMVTSVVLTPKKGDRFRSAVPGILIGLTVTAVSLILLGIQVSKLEEECKPVCEAQGVTVASVDLRNRSCHCSTNFTLDGQRIEP